MPERFSPLSSEAVIFRLATPASTLFPSGRDLPLPEWLAPTSADEAEAAARNRPAGLSVWQLARTTASQARAFGDQAEALAFSTTAGECRSVGATLSIPLDVLHDPLLDQQDQDGWEGHAVIEGLKRPDGAPKKTYSQLREALVTVFTPLP